MADYTLADFEKVAKSQLEQAVLHTWREKSPIMEMLTFKPKAALSIEYVRTKTLPTVPWRDYNDAFTNLVLDVENYSERVHFLGAKSDIPKALVLAESIVDQRQLQDQAIAEAAARAFNYSFINGDPTVDPKGLIGLRYRLVNALAATQYIDAGDLDISVNTAVTNWEEQFFNVIEDLLSRVEGGQADALFMSRLTKLRFEAAMRSAGLKSSTEDKLGKRYPTYGEGGPRLIHAGYLPNDSTEVLTDAESETAESGGANSSIFAVKFGEPYVAGWYEYPPTVVDKGLLEDGITYRTIIDWSPGIYMVHPRSIAWVYDLVVA